MNPSQSLRKVVSVVAASILVIPISVGALDAQTMRTKKFMTSKELLGLLQGPVGQRDVGIGYVLGVIEGASLDSGPLSECMAKQRRPEMSADRLASGFVVDFLNPNGVIWQMWKTAAGSNVEQTPAALFVRAHVQAECMVGRGLGDGE